MSKARIRKDLQVDHYYGDVLFINRMEALKGKEVEIKINLKNNKYLIVEDNGQHYWSAEMFEPVEKPVSFMEAIKAFNKGKTIKCELEYGEVIKYEIDEYNKGSLVDEEGGAITSYEILEGKWFVEEDENNENR